MLSRFLLILFVIMMLSEPAFAQSPSISEIQTISDLCQVGGRPAMAGKRIKFRAAFATNHAGSERIYAKGCDTPFQFLYARGLDQDPMFVKFENAQWQGTFDSFVNLEAEGVFLGTPIADLDSIDSVLNMRLEGPPSRRERNVILVTRIVSVGDEKHELSDKVTPSHYSLPDNDRKKAR